MTGITTKVVSELGKQLHTMFGDFTKQHMELLWKMNSSVATHETILADIDNKIQSHVQTVLDNQMEPYKNMNEATKSS